jgi:hypothetical protein
LINFFINLLPQMKAFRHDAEAEAATVQPVQQHAKPYLFESEVWQNIIRQRFTLAGTLQKSHGDNQRILQDLQCPDPLGLTSATLDWLFSKKTEPADVREQGKFPVVVSGGEADVFNDTCLADLPGEEHQYTASDIG